MEKVEAISVQSGPKFRVPKFEILAWKMDMVTEVTSQSSLVLRSDLTMVWSSGIRD